LFKDYAAANLRLGRAAAIACRVTTVIISPLGTQPILSRLVTGLMSLRAVVDEHHFLCSVAAGPDHGRYVFDTHAEMEEVSFGKDNYVGGEGNFGAKLRESFEVICNCVCKSHREVDSRDGLNTYRGGNMFGS